MKSEVIFKRRPRHCQLCDSRQQANVGRFATTRSVRPLKIARLKACLLPGQKSPAPKLGASRLSAESEQHPPPPYSAGSKPISPGLSAAAAAKAKPPPPKPKPKRLTAAPTAEIVTALYDYAAQAEGDLSFQAGDSIEIVQRTQNENEWWTGKLNGKQGQFPGKYYLSNVNIIRREANAFTGNYVQLG